LPSQAISSAHVLLSEDVEAGEQLRMKDFLKKLQSADLPTFIPVAPTWSIRTSVTHFISLQFLNIRQSVGLLGWEISPSQGRYLHRAT
jgi:hypothetical protein